MVIARAMISDLADGYAGVRALSVMMSIHALVPVVTPVLGGVLATFLPWRGVLAVFAAIVAVQLAVSVVLVRETLPPVATARPGCASATWPGSCAGPASWPTPSPSAAPWPR